MGEVKEEVKPSIEIIVALTKLETMQGVMLERLRLMSDKEVEFKATITNLRDDIKALNKEINEIKAKFSYAAGAVLVVTTVVGFIVNMLIKKFT